MNGDDYSPKFPSRGAKYFTAFTADADGGNKRFQESDWRHYWDSLTDNEQDSLKRKARYERMSLSSIAIDYGALEHP